MKNSAKLLLASLALASLTACLRTPAAIAASSAPLEGRSYNVLGEAYGKSTQYHILGIPAGEGAKVEEAIADAKAKTGADALIEVTADCYHKNFLLFYSVTTEVRGKAIKFTK